MTEAFEVVAGRKGSGALRLMDASSATVPDGEKLARAMASSVEQGARVVAVVDSVMISLAGIPLIRAAQEILLVARVGEGDPEGLTSTIGIVGSDRIIGTVAVPSS